MNNVYAICAGVIATLLTGCAQDEPITVATTVALTSCVTSHDCPAPAECSRATCVSGTCDVEFTSVGSPCNSAVGICQADHSCKDPVGSCKPWIDPPPVECESNADCAANECAPGYCEDKHCKYVQSSGEVCGYAAVDGLRCNWGACCSLPVGVCEAPLPTPKYCTSARECDDGDSCTYDSCELGKCQSPKRPDGVYCKTRASSEGGVSEGQCLSGSCCAPW